MIRPRLNEALTQAIKAQERRAVSTLRLILACLKDRDIAARGKGITDGISDDEIMALLQTMIRQRHESIELYEQGGRLDLAEGERELLSEVAREGTRSLRELASASGQSDESVEVPLYGLTMLGYLAREGESYRLGNWLFERWMRRRLVRQLRVREDG